MLFRKEVLQAQADRFYGPIVIARPISSWFFVGIATAIAVAVLLYLSLGAYTKRTPVNGLLMAANGAVRIQSPPGGVIVERRVEEGQLVKKGDILFILTDERWAVSGQDGVSFASRRASSQEQQKTSLLRAKSVVENLGAQVEQGIREKLASLESEISGHKEEVALQTQRAESAARMLERYKKLAIEGFVSQIELQEKEDALSALKAGLLLVQRQQHELRRSYLASTDELRQLPNKTRSQLEELKRQLASLSQEVVEAQSQYHFAISAPIDGVVTAVMGSVGQTVDGRSLAIVVPNDAALIAHLLAPSRAIGFIEAGQSVRLRYQAFPYQKFGQYSGVVTHVSRSPLRPSELPEVIPFKNDEGVYRITVRLEDQFVWAHDRKIKLLPGMLLEADIEQERKSLVEWIFQPIFSAKKYL